MNNYDEKFRQLEDKLDIVLLTMTVESNGEPDHYIRLNKFINSAIKRQKRRTEEDNIKGEYIKLKQRLSEIETDYSEIVK